MHRVVWWAFCGAVLGIGASRAEEGISVSEARKDENGIRVHDCRSPFQAGTTQIRVLLPDQLAPDRKYPVVYVLPVEAGNESRYGDGLLEVQKLDLANQLDAVFVAPTFAQRPWYADHPTDPEIRQETYFVNAVVPFIDANYPVQAEQRGRRLLGFSKSGWGAWSLILRHPNLFARAAAWDAPLMMDEPGKYGSGPIFGTPAQFKNYHLAWLWKTQSASFQQEPRLLLLGYGNFRAEHVRAHAELDAAGVAHVYRDGPSRAHDWHSGWVQEAVDLLLKNP